MKILTVISVTALLTIFLVDITPHSETGPEIIYAGLPSKPLPDDRDEGNNDGEAADEGYDSMGDGDRRDKKPGQKGKENRGDKEESGGFERYEDWYEPDPAYN